MSKNLNRRKWMKSISGALILAPLFFLPRQASAKINESLRVQFKYQNTPKENMSCASCLEFLPGKTNKDLGGCKILPGDDEISPDGYCTGWNTM